MYFKYRKYKCCTFRNYTVHLQDVVTFLITLGLDQYNSIEIKGVTGLNLDETIGKYGYHVPTTLGADRKGKGEGSPEDWLFQ